MYIATFFIIFFFSLLLFDCNKKSIAVKITFAILLIFLVCQEGFRWQIGTDWLPYYRMFEYNLSGMVEFGYVLFSTVVKTIRNDYSFFLLVIALIKYIALACLIKRFSINPLISLCIAYAIFIPLLGMNRQFLALSVVFFSIYFIAEGKFSTFFLLICFASFFHKTALLFLPAYFLWNLKLEKKKTICILLAATVIGFIGVLNVLPLDYISNYLDAGSAFRLQLYMKNTHTYSMINGCLFRFFIIAVCFSIEIPLYEKWFHLFFKLYLVSVFMYVLFQTSALNILAGRGALYYSCSQIIIIPYIVKYLSRDRIHEMLCWFVFFLLYLYIMQKDINTYALNLGYDIFNPYKSVLFPNGLF
ncbi:hypothetical protein Fisuc_2677 [Fibrobacter succinogenes subsp. succinogenes S85]|uniref:EpsG family protein n=2 Tax=Fibrobacter succinogenes (strain ATCC 19169 / S85) TaxID=59374 RepID=A0ABN3YZX5_FIBSS|nr:EpsG family protein [Fibrobacter succinogenes]ACX76260.1 hypothetical protein Fisuc_2677 [Fibrobacter succinogenes subsp. succinogenes S85]